ncbi:GntR family transcriptional regulator [Effusibacillus lacus]|uniref:GntR family transcriptional regulator n=1 Tax=Effusibacillus lacus TaxID=1348429 RepID=A0A292YMZ2_9BACL|nr:GntR family transcriptional regulator [Effusibacillus lacus]TCS72254.1 GntR family transcriptional regulator [Effusibacillus lacus]GAX90269.1 GntR family transcriptional regulator [Effusibacillus lacus]
MKTTISKYEPVYRQAYEVIRNMIIHGDLSPGTKLVEEKLAAHLGVSRTPVREAIRRLEQEGLVKGKTVIEPSEDELRDSYGIRILLEGYSARCAAENLTSEQKETLKNIIQTGKIGTIEEKVAANTTFHDIIMEASGNRYIIEVIDRMRSLILLCRRKVVHTRDCIHDEHEAICKAIMDGDGERAERLMKQHLQSNLDVCLLHSDDNN